jgi:squalene-hopene/tetraprenyl-beta-curcumene cyclase
MLERFEEGDGLGAIFPPIVWSTIALDALGHAPDSDTMLYCIRQLEGLVIRQNNTARIQPCMSPVWDTSLALRSLADSGMDDRHPAIRQGIDWLLGKECRRKGDWAVTVEAAPSGWAFEHRNAYYPDVDDTAMVILALRRPNSSSSAGPLTLPPELQIVTEVNSAEATMDSEEAQRRDRITAAAKRAFAWLFALQNRDGGWGAFDRDNDREFLCHVPFADHNAMIDPSSPDVTGRVLEALGVWGHQVGEAAVDQAVAYLRRSQQADGSWLGRWGVNYIYGTWQALSGLAAVGVSGTDPMVSAGAQWLLVHQQACGGWGESPLSYADPSTRGQGLPTASQTAWALLGLMAAGLDRHPAVARGIRYLMDHQCADGRWEETQFTGTGFPLVFYLRYHLYPVYFPLLALSRWARAVGNLLEQVDAACLGLAGSEGVYAPKGAERR